MSRLLCVVSCYISRLYYSIILVIILFSIPKLGLILHIKFKKFQDEAGITLSESGTNNSFYFSITPRCVPCLFPSVFFYAQFCASPTGLPGVSLPTLPVNKPYVLPVAVLPLQLALPRAYSIRAFALLSVLVYITLCVPP